MPNHLRWTAVSDYSSRMLCLPMLLACALAQAGSLPAASSTVPGVLLGVFKYEREEGPQAFLDAGHSEEVVKQFKQACANKQRIWTLGLPGKMVCSELNYIEEGGDGPVHALHLQSGTPFAPQAAATVLSLTPITPLQPSARKLTRAEILGLPAAYQTGHLRQVVQQAIAHGAIQILDYHRKQSSIYVVKWKRLDDGDIANDHYLVINRSGGHFRSAGNFEGEIIRFLDVDKDGRPDVQRSISCDGICEAVTSMAGRIKDMVSIYKH